jgi:hypothetical protein
MNLHFEPRKVAADRVSGLVVVLALLVWLVPGSRSDVGLAYVYPEHRHIAAISIRTLDSTRGALLNQLWASARTGFETRMSPMPADTLFAESSRSIDFAAWPAIAGDHSCSAAEMLTTVLSRDWILDVHKVAARLQTRLNSAGTEKFKRTNALRDSDLEMLAVDPFYATRAGANNAHFLLPRPSPDTKLDTYLEICLREGSAMNAIGVYALYHHRALSKARRLAEGGLSERGHAAFVRAMLADEAFGLHFLEDTFASGHVAGSWGDAPLRKGTHDYYNEHGVAVTTWSGASFVVLGDAWMLEQDAVRAAHVVRTSIEQLLDAVRGLDRLTGSHKADSFEGMPDSLNVCAVDFLPTDRADEQDLSLLNQIIQDTPIPGLDAGYGELPRFRSELGPFVGISSALRAGWHQGGFLKNQNGVGFVGGVELALRGGIGLDGVMNESGDGLAFIDLGVVRDAASTLDIAQSAGIDELGAITAAIPSRAAYFARLRTPFWLLPFDLLIAAPVLALTSPEAFTHMGVVAANGGLLGWQSGIATSLGRFQFILGREVGVYFYGWDKDGNRVLAYPDGKSDGKLYLLDITSIQILFPILDYRNFRTFSRDQSSGLHIQLYAGIDIPGRVDVIVPIGGSPPQYGSIWFAGIRASLDWRHYF